MRQKAFCRFLCVSLLLSLCGCVDEKLEGAARSFAYESWVPWTNFFGGIAAIVVGWFLRSFAHRLAWGLVVVGLIFALFITPALFLDWFIVDDHQLVTQGGFLGLTGKEVVKYDDLSHVRMTVEKSMRRRGRSSTTHYMMCERKNGSTAKIAVRSPVSRAASAYFVEKVKARGVSVIE